MSHTIKSSTLWRPLIIIAAVIVIVSGVTFASLQSQQVKLTGSTIQTATADLLLSADGTNFGNAQSGYAFGNLVPGGQAMPYNGYPVHLKNNGGVPLTLRFSVSSTPSNPSNVDLSKVNVILTPTSGGSVQSIPLSTLITANSTGGITVLAPTQLLPGFTTQYTLQVSMASDALSGASATLGNIDFAFNGVAQSN